MSSVPDKPQPATAGAKAARRFGFARAVRLLKHADFERVYKNGRRHFSGHLTAFYLPRDKASGPTGGPRIGLTVGRALGGAVERNRIKRRMREAIRMCLGEFTAPGDVVLNPRKSVLKLDFAELRREVGRAFQVAQKNLARPAEKGK